MKKFLLVFCFCLFAISLSAADKVVFSLTDNGTFVTNEGKNFCVLHYEEKDSIKLQDMFYSYIKNKYSAIDDKVEVFENSIMVSSTDLDEIKYGDAWSGIRFFHMAYSLKFTFREGRVRVEVPSIKIGGKSYGKINYKDWHVINEQLHLFKDGVIASKKAERFVEKINTDVNGYIDAILINVVKVDNEEW